MFGNKSCGSKQRFISTGKIDIPIYFSKMLTELAKAAIRTQPSDLLQWCTIYCDMKAIGEQPPIKEYLDPPDQKLGIGGLTPNTLKALAKTLSHEYETYGKIKTMWNILSLRKKIFNDIIKIGNFKNDIKSNEFIGIAASYLNNTLKGTMILLCDTFSTDNSNGILLETFIEIYQYLARLDCEDIVLSSFENSQVELGMEKSNGISVEKDSQDFSFMSSDSCSLDTEFSCHTEYNEKPATNLPEVKSAEGIMIWRDVNTDYGPESFTDILHQPIIKPPITTTACDDLNYVWSLKKLKDKTDSQDILSLLSDDSVICDDQQSVISFESFSDTQVNSELDFFDEHNNEEYIGNSSSFAMTEFNYENNESKIENEDLNSDIYNEVSSEQINEMSITKYEDNINDIEYEMNEENNDNMNSLPDIEINKDFIVMMALVTNTNGPLPNIETVDESFGDEDSVKSEFSILDKIDLNVNVLDEENDNIKMTKQTFDEQNYINYEKESSDSEISSGSDGFQHSEIDQQSNHSVTSEKNSTHSESIQSATLSVSSKDDLASITDNNKFDEEKLSLQELSVSAQFEFVDTPEEPLNTAEEYEEFLNSSEKSIDIPLVDKTVDDKINEQVKVRTGVVIGIGPSVSEKQIKYVIDWVTKCAKNQNNYVQEHNLIHFQCPPLDHKSMSSEKELVQNVCF